MAADQEEEKAAALHFPAADKEQLVEVEEPAELEEQTLVEAQVEQVWEAVRKPQPTQR